MNNTTKSQPQFATERQVAFAQKVGLDINASTPYGKAYDMIAGYVAANPLSDEERNARSAARRERLESMAPTEKQLAFISKVTKGRYLPTNQLQVQGFFHGLKSRQPAATPAA